MIILEMNNDFLVSLNKKHSVKMSFSALLELPKRSTIAQTHRKPEEEAKPRSAGDDHEPKPHNHCRSHQFEEHEAMSNLPIAFSLHFLITSPSVLIASASLKLICIPLN
jgi:hypothetical protein